MGASPILEGSRRLGSFALVAAHLIAAQGCERSSTAERVLAHTDAEVFEAVAQSQRNLGLDDSSRSSRFLRMDSRPVDNTSLLSPQSPPAAGIGLDDDSTQPSPDAVERIARERRAILKRLGVEEGGPFFFPGCGGVRTGEPRTKPGTTPSGALCPTDWRRYVTVGLPHRGLAQIPENLRRAEPQSFDASEVWTVLVTESSIGSGGQDWKQYAWVLTRQPGRADLSLAGRFLLSWAE